MCLAIAAGAGLAADAEVPAAEPLVQVNGYAITEEDLTRHLRLADAGTDRGPLLAGMGALEREEYETQRKAEVLEALIQRRLLHERAREAYLTGEAAEKALDRIADEEVTKLEKRLGSPLKARAFLSEAGWSVESYRQLQKEDFLVAKLLWDEVYSKVSVSPAEVRDSYEQNRERFRVAETVVYRQILFPVTDPDEEATQRQQAESVLDQVRKGLSFAEAAARWSADAAAHPDGLHEVEVPAEHEGWVPPAVAGLQPGQPPEVRRVPGGYAIVQLDEVRPARIAEFEEVQGQIRERLLARARTNARRAFMEGLEAKARIQCSERARALGLTAPEN